MTDRETLASVGDRPNTVAVVRRNQVLYLRWYNSAEKRPEWHKLDHQDEDRAHRQAKELSKAFGKGQGKAWLSDPTLGDLLREYMKHRSPKKGDRAQKADERRRELFETYFGPGKKPRSISSGEWEDFIEERGDGVIDARGEVVEDEDARRELKPGTVGEDLDWLKGVLRWAVDWRTSDGYYLLDENPLRSSTAFRVPVTSDPDQPVMPPDRYQQMLEVADDVMMEVTWDGNRREIRSHVHEMLVVARGTGRRISAICQLRYEDLLLHLDRHGSIRWPADTDKNDQEKVVPVTATVREALDRARNRPPIGGPLFPSPGDKTAPIDRFLAGKWFVKTEKKAELENIPRLGWHGLRRLWATERKDHPNQVDVAAAGGWKDTRTLAEAYQQSDAEGMLKALEAGE